MQEGRRQYENIMADKTPVRVVFNASNVATGMAEFQSGDTVAVSHGGTGLSSIGSAGEVLKVNAAGNALEFGPEGDVSITNLVAPTNADLTFTTSGTGNIILDAVTVNGTTLSAADSTKITVAEALDVTGALVAATSLNIAGDGATVTGIKDEDNMASNSATKLATQQSIKAYVDSEISGISTTAISQNDSNITVSDSGSGTITVAVDGSTIGTFNASGLQLGTSGARVTTVLDEDNLATNSDTALATQQSIKAYVDAQITAEDLDFQADSGGALSIDLDSETMTFTGGTGIDTSGSGNTVTFAIDSTVATLTGSQTLTNKVLTSPTISTPTITGAMTATSVTANDFTSNGSNADITIAPQGTGNINLTAGGDIDLDADGGDIILKDNGTEFGRFTNSSTDLVIKSAVSDKDIIIKGNDGGAEVTALTFDMSAGGQATFSATTVVPTLIATSTIKGNTNDNVALGTSSIGFSDIFLADGAIINFGDDQDVTLTHIHNTGLRIATNIELQFVDANESIKSDGSKLILTSGGTAFNLPTSDGDDGQALITDGSGNLSFGTVGDPSVSDDSLATVINDKRITSTARTIDSFHSTFQDSVLYYVVSNDHNEDCINVQKVSVCHNDSGAFISSAGVQSKASATMTAFTAGLDNDMIRVKAASSNAVGGTLSFYKFGLGDNSSAATSGNTIVSQNTDLDSASEAIVSFAHATFRGAKLFISVNNNAKTEVGNVEALVVHDGTDAFISQFGGIQTGNNPLITLTAAISGDNVVVSATGGEPNLRVTIHAIMLKDTMVSNADSFANSEAIAPVTITSSATELDTLVESSHNGAVYYFVSKNASEGEFAINEVMLALGSGEIAVASTGFVSTKGTNQIAFTADYKDDAENLGQIFGASTSGASTTVSAYRINLLAK